jgi:uncharacterized membrane protein YadS
MINPKIVISGNRPEKIIMPFFKTDFLNVVYMETNVGIVSQTYLSFPIDADAFMLAAALKLK